MRGVVLGVFVLVFGGSATSGQLPTAQPKFQTASVRSVPWFPHVGGCGDSGPPMRGGPGTQTPRTLTFPAARPIDLLAAAYGIEDAVNQISGLGRYSFAWNDLYRVVATVPRGTTNEQIGPMLQNLLAERFHLVAHRETRNLQIYELVVGESGLKMKKGGTTTAPAHARRGSITMDKEGFPQLGPGCSGMAGGGTIVGGRMRVGARNLDLGDFIGTLADLLARPVLNKTGLTGRYDFNFEYSGEGLAGPQGLAEVEAHRRLGLAASGQQLVTSAAAESALRLAADIHEQLGLTLKEDMVPLDVVVIDYMDEMPTKN
jgi:uncharacterized protein (TIGR03435 family)